MALILTTIGFLHSVSYALEYNMDSLISEALRRYIESHRTEIMESFVRDDVEWGLHGKD